VSAATSFTFTAEHSSEPSLAIGYDSFASSLS
jgi:hypothetical protein